MTSDAPWPFDESTEQGRWVELAADGFDEVVPACVYAGDRLDGGVPLGGLGTGYVTLEGNGKLGFHSIYNDIVPPRQYFQDWLTIRSGTLAVPLSTGRMSYWGHYPVADIRAAIPQLPISLGVRAFTPFVLGDAAVSNMPVALFEIDVHNESSEPLEISLDLDFPEPSDDAMSAALVGPDLASDGEAWRGRIPLHLAPGEHQRTRFAFAWYAAQWRDTGGELHLHRYAQRYVDANAVATEALVDHSQLCRRVLAWQQQVYAMSVPGWLRDALVQSLYSLAKNSVWIARSRKDEWWDDDGWFAHSESHRGCPITETMVCRMHGHFPTLLFFPALERSALRAFKHFQIDDGEVPFAFGQGNSMRDPRFHCQHPLNSGQYAQMVHRLFLCTGDQSVLDEFYQSAKRAIRYQFSLDDDGDGLVNEQAHVRPGEFWPANQFYDLWPWWGTSAYVAGTWLATLASGQALAEAAGDHGFARECDEWLARGRQAYDDKLWTGSYYRVWNDVETDHTNEASLANQLMAQWCTKVLGVPDVLPAARVTQALDTIARLNVASAGTGLVNAVLPSGERYDAGSPGDHAANTFVGEGLCAAMTYLYEGNDEMGLAVTQDLYESIALTSRSPWNQRCLLDSASGLPLWGDDYYSNMAMWAVPAALARQDIGTFARSQVNALAKAGQPRAE